jgi:protein-S-isoprenylcysteine O-methyltransferase Ste14
VGSETQSPDVAEARWRPSPAALRDLLLGRVVPGTFFGSVLLARIPGIWGSLAATGGRRASVTDFLGAANAVMLLAYYVLIVGLYVVRLAPRAGDRRPGVVAAAFGSTFLVVCVPYLPAVPRRDWLLLPADLLSLVGMGCTVWALLYLRRSFAILPQARRLVTGGPYALSRHPLYLGEMVGAWSLFLPALGLPGVIALAANLALLLVRMRAEEGVLARTFGREYAGYRRRVPMLVPILRRRARRARAARPTDVTVS